MREVEPNAADGEQLAGRAFGDSDALPGHVAPPRDLVRVLGVAVHRHVREVAFTRAGYLDAERVEGRWRDATDVVEVVVGGDGGDDGHLIVARDGEYAGDVPTRVDDDALAGSRVADEVDEVLHLSRRGEYLRVDGIGRS